MDQPTPDVSEEDVRRILQRDFPHADIAALWRTIEELDLRERWRVAAACLKNAGGSVDKLRGELGAAGGWYREIILEAEYPGAAKKMFRWDRLSETEKQAIYDKDWQQYDEWFRRP